MTVMSVVIPTKNRQETAENVIRAMTLDECSEFEIVVHDNSSDDRLGMRLDALSDTRVRYVHSAESLNMHENFNRAINLAKGHFIIGIGDDDAVIPSQSVALIHEAMNVGLSAIVPGLHTFSWPGVEHWHWGDYGGRLDPFRPTPGHQAGVYKTTAALERLYSEGAASGLGILPRVYQGYVARSALDSLMADHGTYFPGASPDMANAVALCSYVDRVLVSEQPTVISGHSRKSGAGAGTAGRHHGQIERQSHIPAPYLDNWDNRIPRFWSGRTIYAQSAMNVAELTGRESMPKFNFSRLYAALLVFEPKAYARNVFAAIRLFPGPKSDLILKTAKEMIGFSFQRAQSYIRNFFRRDPGSAPTYDSMVALFTSLRAGR